MFHRLDCFSMSSPLQWPFTTYSISCASSSPLFYGAAFQPLIVGLKPMGSVEAINVLRHLHADSCNRAAAPVLQFFPFAPDFSLSSSPRLAWISPSVHCGFWNFREPSEFRVFCCLNIVAWKSTFSILALIFAGLLYAKISVCFQGLEQNKCTCHICWRSEICRNTQFRTEKIWTFMPHPWWEY